MYKLDDAWMLDDDIARSEAPKQRPRTARFYDTSHQLHAVPVMQKRGKLSWDWWPGWKREPASAASNESTPWKIKHRSWKWWFGRWCSFSRDFCFPGPMLIFKGVQDLLIGTCTKGNQNYGINWEGNDRKQKHCAKNLSCTLQFWCMYKEK